MDLLHYVVDLMLEVADLKLKLGGSQIRRHLAYFNSRVCLCNAYSNYVYHAVSSFAYRYSFFVNFVIFSYRRRR